MALLGSAAAFVVALKVPLCPFALLTRHPCPGCGLTRATLALFHGNFTEALAFHPLSPLLSPLVVGMLGYGAVAYIARGRWSAAEGFHGSTSTSIGLVLFAALIGVWVARFLGAFGGPVAI